MLNIKKHPYSLFLFAVVFLSPISFIQIANHAIDVELHDTYFIISGKHAIWLVDIIFIFLWFIYFTLRKIIWSILLTWLHVLVTIGFLFIILFPFSNFFNLPKRYDSEAGYETVAFYGDINRIVSIFAIVLFFTQMLFIINIIVGVILKTKNSDNK
ncbi:MAG: hypothetical protein H7Y00_15225 [Fimbriimonadaceae bacterium]|nr:hypothetical protein [Chitinophagales bacterium]